MDAESNTPVIGRCSYMVLRTDQWLKESKRFLRAATEGCSNTWRGFPVRIEWAADKLRIDVVRSSLKTYLEGEDYVDLGTSKEQISEILSEEWKRLLRKVDSLLDGEGSLGRKRYRRTWAWWVHKRKVSWTETDVKASSNVKPPARGNYGEIESK